MPRIDPLSLLRCLSVLLGPTGGIKSKEEVHRLANLMTKFSKKLVSKCIYIQILKTTNTDLLSQFMTAGGWNLIHTWLTDGILAKNWALIQELLELLLLCPVDIERLKSNNCPKLIKGLSKEGSHQGVRLLASRLVEQWLKIVKGEAAPNSVPAQIMTVPVQTSIAGGQTGVVLSSQQQQHYSGAQQNADAVESATVHVQDLKLTQQSTASTTPGQVQQQNQEQQQQERLQSQTVQLQVIGKAQQAQIQQQATQQSKKQSFVVVSSQSSVPVYKITIRDGNQVLAKVETDPANINNVLNTSSTTGIEVNGNVANVTTFSIKQEVKKEESEEIEERTRQSDSASTISGQDDVVETRQLNNSEHVSSEVKQTVVSSKDNHDADSVKDKDNKDSKDIVNSDSSKSSDKENRDSHKKDEKKSSSISDKKSSSHHHSSSSKSSKHSSSSSTHRASSHKSSSHRSGSSSSSSKSSSSNKDRSSKDKDKHHSSSSSKHSTNKSKSERDKEREKEKQKKDQAEKDKATLEKVQGQALSSKLGKIPKKRSEDEKSNDTNGRKSSTDSRDSSKENKEKATDSSKKIVTMPEKKNISISIESRKNSQDSMTRPKTVKTFNSKFRSTGLEEEVKPPPPRSKKPNPVVDKKVIPQKLPVLKRPSPLRDTVPLVEKRAKLSLDSPTSPAEEKKGGIKLIPPKPKPMVLQESDMFMDALTASTKSKEQRKRKRRISITKDGSSEAKKQEVTTAENRESTPPPASPSNPEDKSPVALKPNFKFYQDTLEIEDDKEQREKENSEEDVRKEKDLAIDDDKDNRDDDDGSNTPTPEEDVEDTKDSESPEDASSIVSDSSKKDNVNSYSEKRYVDGLRSVLLLQKRKGPKKVLKWKTDLESIRYFELDETERVNVTKTFTDMKQMEKQNEREAFQMARKLNNEDLMEERTRWKPLIPIDLPPPLVEPGKDSREKDIQYAREKGILQALYFNRSMIPDSAAEPDEERHHVVSDPKVIPLDDLTGNKESEKDFTSVPWPEPKPQLTPQPPAVTTFHYPTFSHNQQPMMTPMGPQPTMGPISQMPQQMMTPAHMGPMGQDMTGPMPAGGGGWRTGDGKVVVPDVGMNPMANMPGGFNQGMEGGPMVPPGMMGPPPMYNQQQENYGMMGPEDMGGFNNMNPNNFQGPPGPIYPPGPNFPGPRGVPMHNRGRGGPGWYRGGGPGRGVWRGGGGGWRGNGKQPPVCRQFSKNGYCRVGDKCQYLHPGVNCPPF
ncbi:serine/threonine-protein phosphatase 1 regulatory subunit 10 [Harpegnathos saltator]|uniref:serine/threonine-protein phosphatase 1 regulatory subunit 10 n=1 Tax=Harpegnathos saltator TaxID=610380 RepID=UPI00058AEF19|nr:serine/threonine-protein phosphatase 1 regulatory subunit 10 [Harpegnathos saltator]XP_011154467.1 serine/threonine-protein phosphatase 1 regulatory subunit 10 [Harpegnathos saltator]XP_025159409.1 serine/threonine-protein phosphatase 1 regulatory subunit 10 [Harpegnathos saltator]